MNMTAARRTTRAVAGLALTLALLLPVTTQAAPQFSIPVAGTVSGGTFSGVFTLTSFAVQNGQLVALGTLSGVITTAGGVVGSVLATVAIPVAVGSAACSI